MFAGFSINSVTHPVIQQPVAAETREKNQPNTSASCKEDLEVRSAASTVVAKRERSVETPQSPSYELSSESKPDAAEQASDSMLEVLAHVDARNVAAALSLAVYVSEYKATNRGGRPAEFDASAKQKVCLLLKLGYSRSLAAAELGISRSTITKACQRDAEFRQQVLDAEELFESRPLLTLVKAAKRDWRAAAWLMRNHRPHRSVTNRNVRAENRGATRHLADGSEEAQRSQLEVTRVVAAEGMPGSIAD